MSSSFFSRLDSNLRTSLKNLVIVAGLHIASIEYTVLREKEQFNGLVVEILYLPTQNTEQLIRGKDEKEIKRRAAEYTRIKNEVDL